MLKNIAWLLLTFSICSSNSVAEVVNGKICYTQRKPYKYICREPNNLEDLQRNLEADRKERADRKYFACKFSLFSSWSGEIGKIQKELVALRGIRQMDANELYWAQQDINKQAFLPSETVRAAYEAVSYYGSSVASYDVQINTKEWCLQCAIKRNDGAADCAN